MSYYLSFDDLWWVTNWSVIFIRQYLIESYHVEHRVTSNLRGEYDSIHYQDQTQCTYRLHSDAQYVCSKLL